MNQQTREEARAAEVQFLWQELQPEIGQVRERVLAHLDAEPIAPDERRAALDQLDQRIQDLIADAAERRLTRIERAPDFGGWRRDVRRATRLRFQSFAQAEAFARSWAADVRRRDRTDALLLGIDVDVLDAVDRAVDVDIDRQIECLRVATRAEGFPDEQD